MANADLNQLLNQGLNWLPNQLPPAWASQLPDALVNAATDAGVQLAGPQGGGQLHPNAAAAQIRAQKSPTEEGQAGMATNPFLGHLGGMSPIGLQHSPSLESLMNAASQGYQQLAQMGFLPFGNMMGFNPAQSAQYFMPQMYGMAQPAQVLGQGAFGNGGQ